MVPLVLLDMGEYDRHSQFELVEGKGARGKLLSRRVDTVAMGCIVKILLSRSWRFKKKTFRMVCHE